MNTFRGNTLFASVNQLKFKRTSRRDDLQSLFYLLVCLLHGGKIPGYDCEQNTSPLTVDILLKLSKEKKNLGSKDLCFGPSKELYEFKKEVLGYGFKDEPRYDYLKSLLEDIIFLDCKLDK